MEQKYCQSCGMPMIEENQFGTNADGSKNDDYCCYCFKNGKFTQNFTMDEMIEHCAQFVEEFNQNADKKYSRKEAIAQMKIFFPKLKRWANK